MHHRTIQINHQPDATVFQFIILTFVYSSTCFGRFPAYHQELNDCSGSLWFYLSIVVIVVLCATNIFNILLQRFWNGTVRHFFAALKFYFLKRSEMKFKNVLNFTCPLPDLVLLNTFIHIKKILLSYFFST
jgi:hypothetical protein